MLLVIVMRNLENPSNCKGDGLRIGKVVDTRETRDTRRYKANQAYYRVRSSLRDLMGNAVPHPHTYLVIADASAKG